MNENYSDNYALSTSHSWIASGFLGMSLDGYIARKNDDLSWLAELTSDPSHHVTEPLVPARIWEEFFPKIDTVVMGSNTYKVVAGFNEWPFEDRKVFVLSKRLDLHADPRISIVRSIDDAVTKLDEVSARKVYVDGGKTVQTFLEYGLLDEITVSIAPILIGSGKKLFGKLSADVRLVVLGTHTSDEGLVRVTYRVKKR